MPVRYAENRATFDGEVSVHEVESLQEWLQERLSDSPIIDLAAATHLHCAVVQVILTVPHLVEHWPANPELATWLESMVSHSKDAEGTLLLPAVNRGMD